MVEITKGELQALNGSVCPSIQEPFIVLNKCVTIPILRQLKSPSSFRLTYPVKLKSHQR